MVKDKPPKGKTEGEEQPQWPQTASESGSLGEHVEDYLKAIYQLSENGLRVSTSAIAEQLGIKDASVTGMLKKLEKAHLISYVPYQGVQLLPKGEKIALEILRHHRLLELYLAQTLGYSWDQVHSEADKLEHVISEAFEEKLDLLLGHPQWDPHGDPIPGKDGTIECREVVPLTDLQVGSVAIVQRVSDRNAEMLRYLSQINLFPQALVELCARQPFGGSYIIKINGHEQALGQELAGAIYVYVAPSSVP